MRSHLIAVSMMAAGFAAAGQATAASPYGRYSVSGTEVEGGCRYSFSGTVILGRSTGIFRLRYNDGDRAGGVIRVAFRRPIQPRSRRQVVAGTWRTRTGRGRYALVVTQDGGCCNISFTYAGVQTSGPDRGLTCRGRGTGWK